MFKDGIAFCSSLFHYSALRFLVVSSCSFDGSCNDVHACSLLKASDIALFQHHGNPYINWAVDPAVDPYSSKICEIHIRRRPKVPVTLSINAARKSVVRGNAALRVFV